ncbi:hypothetical protein Tcan_02194 [Toxocara canis]|uniref:Uncharacterized protein n=1 Tax=Toxocara canis TaxID=6265 RepID=A0A0B2UQT8_TOXCA|nr:hypothetical protein Tcan_02194 [Toxocara canis]
MEGTEYYTYIVPTTQALLYHIRLISPGNLRDLFEDNTLSRYAPLWQKQWQSRVADETARLNYAPSGSLSLANTTWIDHGMEVGGVSFFVTSSSECKLSV